MPFELPPPTRHDDVLKGCQWTIHFSKSKEPSSDDPNHEHYHIGLQCHPPAGEKPDFDAWKSMLIRVDVFSYVANESSASGAGAGRFFRQTITHPHDSWRHRHSCMLASFNGCGDFVQIGSLCSNTLSTHDFKLSNWSKLAAPAKVPTFIRSHLDEEPVPLHLTNTITFGFGIETIMGSSEPATVVKHRLLAEAHLAKGSHPREDSAEVDWDGGGDLCPLNPVLRGKLLEANQVQEVFVCPPCKYFRSCDKQIQGYSFRPES